MSLPLFYIKNAEVKFGNKVLFSDLSFQVSIEDKICLVGRNGSGKTTIFRTIANELELDKGEIYFQPGIHVGYLPQAVTFGKNETIYEHVLKGLDFHGQSEKENKLYLADMVLDKLGLHGDKPMSKLSGGKLRRAALARSLVAQPELLLLDEPTNHLDIGAILWLEDYLINYKGGVICISHDRRFLENISNKTFWLDRGNLKVSNRGFKYFEEWSEQVMEAEEKEIAKLGKKLEGENHWLLYGVTARRKRNQQRLSNLHALRERLKNEKASQVAAGQRMALPPLSREQAAKMVVEFDDVSFGYNDHHPQMMIRNFSIRIIRGEKIGIMGKNGAGKTTLLKLLTGQLEPSSGKIRRGANLEISYFDQNRDQLDPSLTLWKTLVPSGGDMVKLGNDRFLHVVAYLKQFLFTPQEAEMKVSMLSGGQSNRLLLAKTLANPGNLLILDEPTNDLDMDSLEVLLETLEDFKGTLIIVSHDRDFIDKLVTRTLIFDDNHKIHDFIGGYSDWQAPQAKQEIAKKKAASTPKPEEKAAKAQTKLSYKDARDYEIIPGEIQKLMDDIKNIETQLADPALYSKNPERYQGLTKLLQAKKDEIDAKEMRWLEIDEMATKLQS